MLDKLITVEGELAFPSPPAAILDIAGTASLHDLKVLNAKAVAKGTLHVLCAWRAKGESALQSQSLDLPFNQVLDVEGLSEDCRCLCVAEPVGFTATQGEGEAPGSLSATVMLRLRAWRPYQLQCVADAFSTQFETEPVMQNLRTEALLCALNETATLTGSGPLPDAGAKILACFAAIGPAQLVWQQTGWVVAARVLVTAFGENSLAELESYEKPLELALPIPAEAAETAALYPECWLSVEDLQCSCTGGALDVSVTVRVEGAILSRRQASCVGSIALGEKLAPADPEISLRIYYAQAGEALFAIAKRYHVSPGQMLAANDLAEGTTAIEKAQRLLIPGA